MQYIALLIFSAMFSTLVKAEPIKLLQQRANTAYEQMMEAKHQAQHAAQDANRAAQEFRRVKKQLLEAEQKANITKTKSEAAHKNLTQATNKWNQASEALTQQWRQSK